MEFVQELSLVNPLHLTGRLHHQQQNEEYHVVKSQAVVNILEKQLQRQLMLRFYLRWFHVYEKKKNDFTQTLLRTPHEHHVTLLSAIESMRRTTAKQRDHLVSKDRLFVSVVQDVQQPLQQQTSSQRKTGIVVNTNIYNSGNKTDALTNLLGIVATPPPLPLSQQQVPKNSARNAVMPSSNLHAVDQDQLFQLLETMSNNQKSSKNSISSTSNANNITNGGKASTTARTGKSSSTSTAMIETLDNNNIMTASPSKLNNVADHGASTPTIATPPRSLGGEHGLLSMYQLQQNQSQSQQNHALSSGNGNNNNNNSVSSGNNNTAIISLSFEHHQRPNSTAITAAPSSSSPSHSATTTVHKNPNLQNGYYAYNNVNGNVLTSTIPAPRNTISVLPNGGKLIQGVSAVNANNINSNHFAASSNNNGGVVGGGTDRLPKRIVANNNAPVIVAGIIIGAPTTTSTSCNKEISSGKQSQIQQQPLAPGSFRSSVTHACDSAQKQSLRSAGLRTSN